MAEEQKELQDKVVELTSQLEASQKSNKELLQEKELLAASLEAHQKHLSDISADKTPEQSKRNLFEHEGRQYELVVEKARVPHDGEVVLMSAADILATDEVKAHLVKVDSGLIREVK